jgi:hypothetical protein
MESMLDYVIRRADEVKRYKDVIAASGINASERWLRYVARDGQVARSVRKIETLYSYYKTLEANESRGRGRPKSASLYKARKGEK